MANDTLTRELLLERFEIYKQNSDAIASFNKKLGKRKHERMPNFPEMISENLIKFILHDLGMNNVRSDGKGDLTELLCIIECKCFSSIGPLSFSPKSKWDFLYVLDAVNAKNGNIILYEINLSSDSEKIKNIKVNKIETFENQCKDGKRPRINWKQLHSQIKDDCKIVYDGKVSNLLKNSK